MIYTTIINEFNTLKDPPNKIYYKGNLELLKMPKISIVGSRKMSVYTKNLTFKLAQKLSQIGICVVSGGAIGVDIESAKASLPYHIGVFANGLNEIYPKSNEYIIKQIYENALALSENEPNHIPLKHDFLARNRLVVALGDILIITQADLKSGSLNSAKHALEYGKDIYVLAQRIGESDGTNELIANYKAKIIYDIDVFVAQMQEYFSVQKCYTQNYDEFLEFCKNGANLDEALERYGELVYDYELDGKIIIDGVLVRSV